MFIWVTMKGHGAGTSWKAFALDYFKHGLGMRGMHALRIASKDEKTIDKEDWWQRQISIYNPLAPTLTSK